MPQRQSTAEGPITAFSSRLLNPDLEPITQSLVGDPGWLMLTDVDGFQALQGLDIG